MIQDETSFPICTAVDALYAAVVDTKTDRVVYYSRVLSNADHPLSRKYVGEQMKKLLRDFER